MTRLEAPARRESAELRTFGEMYERLAAMDDATYDAWESEPSGRVCRCGVPLANWEACNGKCDRCRLAQIHTDHDSPVSASAGLSRAGIPARYLKRSWANWHGPRPAALDSWRQCIDEPLYIYGDNRTGKTHAATALLAELIAQGVWCVWASALQLQQALVDEVKSAERPLWQRLRKCTVLLLDDVSAVAIASDDNGDKRWAREQLESLIDERYMESRGVIATSNKDPLAFHQLNSRIAVRLCSGIKVPMTKVYGKAA